MGRAARTSTESGCRMTFDEALHRLNGLEGRGWRLGLDRMRALVDRAGLSETLDRRGYIHVAGTNGKGTVTAFVESILRHQGWSTGAFYSPYVVDYRERIQADGRMIEKQELAELVERLLPVADAMAETPLGGATKFELEAAMGLAYWEQKRSDWVALEVGLGGRLDATNVVSPKACVIVSIGLDHVAILGDTLEAIAAEKAGIVKPGVPVMVGEMAPEAFAVIERVAEELAAPVWRMGREIQVRSSSSSSFETITPIGAFRTPLPKLGSEFPPHSAPLAVAACAAAGAVRDASAVGEGVDRAWLPGRMDWRRLNGREILLDGAHNEPAARMLRRKLGARPIHLVTNMLGGHEVAGFLEALKECVVRAEVAPIDVPRALSVPAAVAQIEALAIPARGHDTVAQALAAAVEADDGLVVVTGSNYLVGDALRYIADLPEG